MSGSVPPPRGDDGTRGALWRRTVAEAIERYHEVLNAYVDHGGEDYLALLDRMVERGAVFAGRPICAFLRPHLLLRSQLQLLEQAIRHFRSAVIKTKDALVADPKLLDEMGLTDGERRLLAIDPEFKSFGVVTRLDTILDGDDLSLVELNAEGAFGVSYADRLTELFEGFQPMREFARGRPASPLYSGNALVGAVLDAWHEFGGKRVPRVAVVDWKEVATRTEFEMVCEAFQRHGIPARFVDPRDLEIAGKKLVAGGEPVDLVYRRVLTSEVLARELEVRALLEAYSTRTACVVNSFRAKLLDKKMLFAMLQDERITGRYSADEAAAVRRYVPWTRRVGEGQTTAPDGDKIDLLPYCIDKRLELVLKPNDQVGGRGVVIGANVEASVWERALKTALVDPSVVQRRVELPSAMFPEVGAAGELFYSRRYVELDPYLFRGAPRGMMGRLSATTMLSVQAGAGAVPAFVIEDPERTEFAKS